MPKISLVNQDINLDTIESLLKSQYSSDGYKIEKVSNRRIYLEKSVTDCFSITIKNKGETTQVLINGNLGGFFRSKAGRIIVIAFLFFLVLSSYSMGQITNSIEGRWLWSPIENSPPNTMYEFLDGTRYTYYCDSTECDESYWNSLDTSDALPPTNPYIFQNDTLTIDLHFGNELITSTVFECDGDKVYFETSDYYLIRLGAQLEDCFPTNIESSPIDQIKLFPNPSRNNITIQCSGEFDFKVLSIDGKTVLSGSGLDAVNCELAEFPRGQYTIVVSQAGKANHYKVILN